MDTNLQKRMKRAERTKNSREPSSEGESQFGDRKEQSACRPKLQNLKMLKAKVERR
ncbi:hypothetical protein MTR67_007487 [Solanum verrucosum]|uniref:Uncharacterized protein n=1 Tax=Solanum verrucosum TaxID=315347 RepID=A0AAF0Q0B6_SOLVR|nr:hypothetical protein MTR67_007487 [Solanum verrucosum]